MDHLLGWAMFSVGSLAFQAGFSIILLAVLDLYLFRRQREAVSLRAAAARTAAWTVVGLLFALVAFGWGSSPGQELVVGFLFEKLLVVGNVYVVACIIKAFRLPRDLERRVLVWAVIGAWALRGAVIGAGTALLGEHPATAYSLGVVAVLVGVALVKSRKSIPVLAIRVAKRVLGPRLNEGLREGSERPDRQVVSVVLALVVLLVIAQVEVANFVFALAANSTIHAVTEDALVIWMSNGLALLGLGPLYFLVSKALLRRFHLLEFGLASLLFVVGGKLILAGLVSFSLGSIAIVGLGAFGFFAAGTAGYSTKERRGS